MIYLDATSALEFWTSPARASVDVRRLRRFSELADCPATLYESAGHVLDSIPCHFSRPELAVPDASLRVERRRFAYHVRTRGIPVGSYLLISRKVCVASPALALAQASQKLSVVHLAQIICEMRGSYVRKRGERAGMLDELSPIVTITEIQSMIETTRGIFKCERLEKALPFTKACSASPKETELLLLLAFTKRRGGAAVPGWEMNPELPVPPEYRTYLDSGKVRPDLFNRDKGVDLEYVSRSEHDNPKSEHHDSKRTNVLRSMGIDVIPVHPEDIATASAFEVILHQTKQALGLPFRKTSKEGLAARARLMAELRTMPAIGYPSATELTCGNAAGLAEAREQGGFGGTRAR